MKCERARARRSHIRLGQLIISARNPIYSTVVFLFLLHFSTSLLHIAHYCYKPFIWLLYSECLMFQMPMNAASCRFVALAPTVVRANNISLMNEIAIDRSWLVSNTFFMPQINVAYKWSLFMFHFLNYDLCDIGSVFRLLRLFR